MRLHWIVFLSIAMAGCGGGGALSREEFVDRADAICAEHNQRIRDIFADVSPPVRGDELEDLLREYTEAFEDLSDELGDLDAPEDRAIEQFLDRLERNAQGLRDGLEQGDANSEAFVQANMNSAREARDLASDAGLGECAELES